MVRLLLLSILVASIAMPSLAAGDPGAAFGLRKLLVRMFTFVLSYWLVIMFFTAI